MKFFRLFLISVIALISTTTLASSYKCKSESLNPDVVRYEVELSFDPIHFRIDTYLKENDGTWSVDNDWFATAEAILTPVKIKWEAFKTELKSDESKISFHWSKSNEASGYMNLDLSSKSGEFYASYQNGGLIYRNVRFSDCQKDSAFH